MAREHHAVMKGSERSAQCQVVLVDEEPPGHGGLRRQRALLLLMGDGGTHQFARHLVADGQGVANSRRSSSITGRSRCSGTPLLRSLGGSRATP